MFRRVGDLLGARAEAERWSPPSRRPPPRSPVAASGRPRPRVAPARMVRPAVLLRALEPGDHRPGRRRRGDRPARRALAAADLGGSRRGRPRGDRCSRPAASRSIGRRPSCRRCKRGRSGRGSRRSARGGRDRWSTARPTSPGPAPGSRRACGSPPRRSTPTPAAIWPPRLAGGGYRHLHENSLPNRATEVMITRISRSVQHLAIQQLVAELAVERLDVPVLPRRPRLDVHRPTPGGAMARWTAISGPGNACAGAGGGRLVSEPVGGPFGGSLGHGAQTRMVLLVPGVGSRRAAARSARYCATQPTRPSRAGAPNPP